MAEEVYRIEIPVTVEDRSEPALSNVEKKVSKFDQTADRTRKRLDQMNRTRWQLAVYVLDRASTMINHIGALARRVASGSYRITVRVLDMATAPFRAILQGMNSALGILGIGAGTAGGIVVPLKIVMQQQNIETAFEVLLGSAEAAKKRVEELTSFAGSTPFTRDEIYESSRILQVFTGNAISTGEGLRMVGDIAAGTQQQFGDVALWVGRLYDAMAAGRPVGEMTSRLQEMGAISGDGRDRLEKLAASGKNISQTWPLATKEFARFDGMMEKLSDNLANLMLGVKSFFMNNIIKRWGQGLSAGITPILQSFRQWRKENPELIAQMGDQVERVAARFSRFFVDRIQIMSRRLQELFNDEQFKNADLFGKVKIAWDKIISEPFATWWAGGGKEQIDKIAASIGGALGAGLNSVLLGLFGMTSNTEEISESPFVSAGASAGRSFLEAFLEAFDANEIAKKAKEAFLNLQPTWLGGETSSGAGQMLALMMDAWLISKAVKILKGPFKMGRAITRWVRGSSAATMAETTATAATATRTTAAAAETAKRAPWYRRWFGGWKGAGAATAADAIPNVSAGPAAHLPGNYRPAGKQFWGNIPLDRTYSREEVVRMANAGQLGRYSELEKAFGGPVPAKTSWWKSLFKGGGGRGMGFLSRSVGKLAMPLSIGLDAATISAAAPGAERNQAIGGTVGGWGGFAAGAAGGAALGSVIPGIGTAIGGTIGGIVGSLGGGAIGEWIGKEWENLSAWFDSSVWSPIKEGASAAGQWVADQWDEAKSWVSNKWNDFSSWFGTNVWTPIKDAGIDTINFTVGLWDMGKETVKSVWDPFASWFDESVWTPIKEDAAATNQWLSDRWSEAKSWISEQWADFSGWFDETVWAPVKEGAAGAGQWLSDRWDESKAWITEQWADFSGWFDETVWSPIKEGADIAGQWFSDRWDETKESIQDTWSDVSGWFGTSIWDPIKTGAETAAGWIRDRFGEAKSWVKNVWSDLTNWFDNNVAQPVSDWVGDVRDRGAEITGLQTSNQQVRAYARGGFITRPHMGLVGEAGPEAIIPLSPSMRGRGRELWEQAGQMLGIRPFASGGIVGATPTTVSASVAPMAGGISISLGGINFSITVAGDGQDVIEEIRKHGDAIADEIAGKIASRLGEANDNSV